MAYEEKAGEGSAWETDFDNDKAPRYKGHLILPDGSVIGVAVWEGETKGGKRYLSLKVDDKEGAFQAKRLKRSQTRLAEDDDRGSRDRRDDRRDDRRPSRDDDRRGERRSDTRVSYTRGGDRDTRRDDRRDDRRGHDFPGDRGRSSGRRDERGLSDDMNDEIPFD